MFAPQQSQLDWSKTFMYSLHETYFLIQKRLETRLAKQDAVTFSQFLILLSLQCQSEGSQSDVANFLHITEATVSRHMSTMEKEGLLQKKEVPDNRRKHLITLTPKGAAAFKKAHTVIEKELKEIFAVIPEKDRTHITNTFDTVLKKLID